MSVEMKDCTTGKESQVRTALNVLSDRVESLREVQNKIEEMLLPVLRNKVEEKSPEPGIKNPHVTLSVEIDDIADKILYITEDFRSIIGRCEL